MPAYVPYNHATGMTRDQFLSLFEWHHNKFYSFTADDHFTNLSPLPIKEHRRQTKIDAKVIAKSKRIRAWNAKNPKIEAMLQEQEHLGKAARHVRRLQSRGFDKTRRRRIDGTVVKR